VRPHEDEVPRFPRRPAKTPSPFGRFFQGWKGVAIGAVAFVAIMGLIMAGERKKKADERTPTTEATEPREVVTAGEYYDDWKATR
jgi:hypothetical protein